jgi:E3 ubiquitin-protein ligase RNF14
VELPSPLDIEIVSPETSAAATCSQLRILPSVLLTVVFPPAYPLQNGPKLLSIRSTHMWIPHISELRQCLLDLWTPGETALYNWIEFIRNAEFLQSLGLLSEERGNLLVYVQRPFLQLPLNPMQYSASHATSIAIAIGLVRTGCQIESIFD